MAARLSALPAGRTLPPVFFYFCISQNVGIFIQKFFLPEQGNFTVLLQLVDTLGIILTDYFKKSPRPERTLSLLSLRSVTFI
jgi:hypothetical protein